jgi:uncharacterized membrane protein
MNTIDIVIIYGITFVVFFALDILWLGFLGRNIYRKYLGHHMREKVLWPAAILFYLLYMGGIIWYAVLPGIEAGSPGAALLHGMLFGFITYMTYELTSLAVIREWSLPIVIIDITWGIVLGGLTSMAVTWIALKMILAS